MNAPLTLLLHTLLSDLISTHLLSLGVSQVPTMLWTPASILSSWRLRELSKMVRPFMTSLFYSGDYFVHRASPTGVL